MGKIIKTLLCTFCACFFLNFYVFAQNDSSNSENSRNLQAEIDESTILLSDLSESDSEITDDETEGESTVWIFVRMIIVLLLVVAAIYGIMYVFKKKTDVVKDDDDFLRHVASIDVAPGKSVEIVSLLDKNAYILGVSDSSVNLISEITDKELIEAMNLNADKKKNVKKPMNFSDVLDIFTGKKFSNNSKNTNIYSGIKVRSGKIENHEGGES